ncbi:TetR/AcrR family transcriptional regulator [Carboxylicivirga sp. M1479]|uniref:TetR/AcrR family transcriptional regulator n=1 Tax=Carboxylicivirga sp. M1479 TaxID=2594476 RepID=UPI001177C50E|nr:TetR/AcrR family transcriptional regulator [Carboxylicivirga sp. M1479]TRX72687.1 TetR/AcrR family transcriptional regulator [Carboxylicivirga sp. M1479]
MDKREQLIDIATKLFSERGYENTPLSVVCEKANVSKGLISHHFKSKDGLLREIFLKTTQLIVEINAVDTKNKTPNEQLVDLLESFFIQLEVDKMFFQFSLNTMLQPRTREVLKDLISERATFILKSVTSIFNKLDKAKANVLSYMFIAELDGVAINYLAGDIDFPLSDIKQHLIEKYRN